MVKNIFLDQREPNLPGFPALRDEITGAGFRVKKIPTGSGAGVKYFFRLTESGLKKNFDRGRSQKKFMKLNAIFRLMRVAHQMEACITEFFHFIQSSMSLSAKWRQLECTNGWGWGSYPCRSTGQCAHCTITLPERQGPGPRGAKFTGDMRWPGPKEAVKLESHRWCTSRII